MHWSKIFDDTFRNVFSGDACYFALAAIGLNVQFGYAGLLNFGQVGFLACGAYGMAMTSQYYKIGLWWGLGIGVIYTAFLAFLVSIPILRRLRPDYMAIVTIAMAEMIRLIVRSVQFQKAFGGGDGINQFANSFYRLNPFNHGQFYGLGPFRYTGNDVWLLIWGWSLVLIIGFGVYMLMRSPWGRVVKAIREDEDAVRSLVKNVYGYQFQSLAIGGFIGMLSGVVLALKNSNVQPDNYSRDVTFYILTALVLGGVAKVTGSIVGPMIFWMLLGFTDSFLSEAVDKNGRLKIGPLTVIHDTSQIGQFRFMLIGLGLMLLMIFRPQGLFGNRKEMALDGH